MRHVKLIEKNLIWIVIMGLALGACSREDQPKDYWQMSPPILVYSETHSKEEEEEEDPPKTRSLLVSDMSKKSKDLWTSRSFGGRTSPYLTKNSLSYKTHLEFRDLDPHVKFDILTHCNYFSSNEAAFLENMQEKLSFKDSEEEFSKLGGDIKRVLFREELSEETLQSLEAIKKSRGFSKLTPYMNSKIHFLYNYLPDEVIFDPFYGIKDLSINYDCSFNITARNKIGSTHRFQIKGLIFNTSQANELSLKTYDNESSSSSDDSLKQVSKTSQSYSRDNDYPFLTYENNKFTYKLSHYNSQNFLTPTRIKCLGQENDFYFPEYKDKILPLNFRLRDVFESRLAPGSTAFLKKCRVISKIEPMNKDGQKVIWSDYFNVIFDRPQIEVSQIFEKHDPRERYPYSKGTYKDEPYGVFGMKFSNYSKKRSVRIHLPKIKSKSVKFGVLARDMQNPNKRVLKVGSRQSMKRFNQYVQVQEEFWGSIWFATKNLERIYVFDLNPEESLEIQLVIDKPFSCTFLNRGPLGPFYENGAESGFRISALDIRQGSDLVRVDYYNQGQFERFPSTYFWHQLFSSYPNHLKKNLKTPFAIDTYVVRPQLRRIRKHDVRVLDDPWRFAGGVNVYKLGGYNYKWDPYVLGDIGEKNLAYPINDFHKSFCISLDPLEEN